MVEFVMAFKNIFYLEIYYNNIFLFILHKNEIKRIQEFLKLFLNGKTNTILTGGMDKK